MKFCEKNIPGIKFFNVEATSISDYETKLKPRFELSKTIKGTLQLHRFVQVSGNELRVFNLSLQTEASKSVFITEKANETSLIPAINKTSIQKLRLYQQSIKHVSRNRHLFAVCTLMCSNIVVVTLFLKIIDKE
ncbi:hypothetical protein SNE40_002847 [Patella caerulea]|uniref:Uncharacterized protein n=1 Tax=Patella caerulea TaxID=87958 RepID=A0AAN8Q7Y3_PATCE